MKKNKKFKNRNRDENKNSPFEERKKFCPFSQKNSPIIDYKDIKLDMLAKKGKLYLAELLMYHDLSKKNYQRQ